MVELKRFYCQNRYGEVYVSDDGWVMRRDRYIWVLFNAENKAVDEDWYRNDLADRNNIWLLPEREPVEQVA